MSRLLPIKYSLITPYKHQVEAYKLCMEKPGAALLMEQRTGKTLVAMAAAGSRYELGQIKRLLIIAPTKVIPVWDNQIEEFADFNHKIVSLIDMPVSKRIKLLRTWENTSGLQIAIVNYNVLHNMREALVSWKPNMIIADESHKLQHGQAQQTRAALAISKEAEYKIILTASPVHESPLSVFYQYKFTDPSIYGTSYGRFKDKYVATWGYGHYKPRSFKNLKLFSRKLHSIAFRVKRDDCMELPADGPMPVYVDLEKSARKLYEEMNKEFICTVHKDKITAPIILSKLIRLQQITGGFVKGESGEYHHVSSAKLKATLELLSELLLEKRKVIIFARFIPEVKAISEALTRRKIQHYVLTGKTKQKELKEILYGGFVHNPHKKVVISQIASGSLGCDLSSACYSIFYSVDFSFTNYDQARCRLLGPKQKHKVTHFQIMVKKSIDEELVKRLNEKEDLSTMVVDELRSVFKN